MLAGGDPHSSREASRYPANACWTSQPSNSGVEMSLGRDNPYSSGIRQPVVNHLPMKSGMSTPSSYPSGMSTPAHETQAHRGHPSRPPTLAFNEMPRVNEDNRAPEIGDSVYFKDYGGCTIIEIFADNSAYIHIPGYGTEMVGPEEWEPKEFMQHLDETAVLRRQVEDDSKSDRLRQHTPDAQEEGSINRMQSRDETDKAMEAILAEHFQEEEPDTFASSWLSNKAVSGGRRNHEVWLHVYDLDPTTRTLNDTFLRGAGLGFFHCGVEVLGDEWFFAWGDSSSSTGVLFMAPKSHMVHVYKESVNMGTCPLTEIEVRTAIHEAMKAWPADSYHIVNRNCVHFAEDLLRRLQVATRVPDWIRGASDAGQNRMIQPIADWGWSWMKYLSTEHRDRPELAADDVPEEPSRADTFGGCCCVPKPRR